MLSKVFLAAALAVCLTACGGGGSASAPVASAAPVEVTPTPAQRTPKPMARVLINQGVAAAQNDPDFDVSFFLPELAGDPSVQAQVAAQVAYRGSVGILTSPGTKSAGFDNFAAYVDAAKQYPNAIYAYGYDEVGWKNGVIDITADAAGILTASQYTHAAGMKFAVTMMPNVVLDPNFALAHPDEYDVIALDLYPGGLLNQNTYGCSYNDNPYTTMLYCSIKKLREAGYQGEIWYIYQGFGLKAVDPLVQTQQLTQQRETILAAASLGVTGIGPYGLYWSLTGSEPYYQGAGTAIEALVRLP